MAPCILHIGNIVVHISLLCEQGVQEFGRFHPLKQNIIQSNMRQIPSYICIYLLCQCVLGALVSFEGSFTGL